MSIIGKPRDERGAVAPFVAVLMVVLVGLASFAVDLGYQRVAARDMQAVADIVAMDMARQLDGRKTSILKNTDAWRDAVRASLARNDDRAVGQSLTVVNCEVAETTLDNAEICATPGIYNPVNKTFVGSGNAPATHVRVITRTKIDYFFPIFANDGWVTKTAYAEIQGQGCIQLGSYAARLDTNKSPLLGGLLNRLGTGVTLSAGDYNALANANVGLLGLINAPVGAVTMQELISTGQGISLANFYLAAADVLARESGNTAAVGVLGRMAAAVPGVNIAASEILSLGSGGTSGLATDANILDLVTAAAAVAAKDRGLSIPQVGVNVPIVGNLTASLSAIEGLKPYCGSPRDLDNVAVAPGRSAAATLTVESTLLPVDVIGLLNTKVQLTGVVKVASAAAKISSIKCDPTRVKVRVRDGIAEVDLALRIQTGIIGGLLKLEGNVYISGSSSSTGEPEVTILTDGDFDKGWATSGTGSGLPELHTNRTGLKATLLGLEVPIPLDILGFVLDGIVNPLVQGLDEALLAPLFKQLGLDLSGADLKINRTPTCGGVALRG